MRAIGTLFVVVGFLAYSIGDLRSQTQTDNPPPAKPPSREGTTDTPPAAKPPIRHTTPEPPTIDPHAPHEGHDLRNAAIGGGAGFVAGLLLGRAMSGKDSPDKMLSDHGPQTPKVFSMSSFSLMGFVKGNWPAVLDYEVRQPGLYLLTVSTDNAVPFSYLLEGAQPGRRIVIMRLPARFGAQAKPGSYTIQAIHNAPGEVTPVYLRVFGIGAGDRAVGSVAIDQLQFGPPDIKPQQRQNATYGFHSHADFEKVTAEFERVGLVDGGVVTELEDQEDIREAVRRDTAIANKQWDPRKRKARPGQHMLQVRAWYTLKAGGDWVVAWSPGLVRLEE